VHYDTHGEYSAGGSLVVASALQQERAAHATTKFTTDGT
jgi:hypothetical protein